ncbi:MAG: AAA family ATPase [Gammaproteobacteria bacterium]
MYFTAAQVARSIDALVNVHSFHGITFLACKKAGLPVGREIVFPLDAETDKFLREHHRIDPGSDWFFQPFKSSGAEKKWVRPDYAAKGLQSINTRTFRAAFLHERNSRIWGWMPNYVDVLKDKLPQKRKIPVFDLAVWLFRDLEWPEDTSSDTVVARFTSEYSITPEEQEALFDVGSSSKLALNKAFQPTKFEWRDLHPFIPAAPDAKPEQGGALIYLETRGLGPANLFVLEPANRLSLITGDNGLGKSFLLEAAWWALTGMWAERPFYPSPAQRNFRIEITFAIEGEHSKAQPQTIVFDWKTLSWPQLKKRPTMPGLTVYARVDGSFAVWDPARAALSLQDISRLTKAVFSRREVWDGLPGRIEGLIRDWTRWQSNPSGGQFETFRKVLKKLSPPDLGQLEPGMPVRVPEDPRDIPTLVHPYGATPIIYASAGVRRIVTLAYLIVWAWHEHVIAAEMVQTNPQRRMVVLVDEIEAHLHPLWQRALLPALMEVGEVLAPALQTQYLVATHSPLVMASSETVFNAATDKLFHLDMAPSGEVTLKTMEYIRFGDACSWLTSPVFGLRHARSPEAEAAIETAKALQSSDKAITKDQITEVTEKLMRYLVPDDRFWPRWITFAEGYGVYV